MKEIDIGDEVKVKNEQGIFIVEKYSSSYSYIYGSETGTLQYKLKAKDSSKTIYAHVHEVYPVKNIKQKIDELLDTYNDLIQMEEAWLKDGYFKKQAEHVMKQLKSV